MTSTAGWTPGPWIVENTTVYALDETQSCNRFSARVEGGWQWRSADSIGASGDRTPSDELLANARLIAAAPALYEALKAITAYPGIREYVGNLIYDRARAALSLAAGEKGK